MVYRVRGDGPIVNASYQPPAFCAMLGSTRTPPRAFGFRSLGTRGVGISLGTEQTCFLPGGGPSFIARASGLLTCACVIYYKDGDVYLHHANTGDVEQGDFNRAIAVLGRSPAAVWVIYAHPLDSDRGYESTLDDIVRWGVPTNHIAQITNLPNGQFGINHLGWLGW